MKKYQISNIKFQISNEILQQWKLEIRNWKYSPGFTLIELLIVIAVLGLLAAVVLVALDPIEQTAKARDSGRINTIAQLGRAMQTFASTNAGQYPTIPSSTWMDQLVATGDIKNAVTVPLVSGSTNVCSTNMQNNICYDYDETNNNIIIWTVVESKGSKTKPNPDCTATQKALVVYSSLLGKAGILCSASANTTVGTITAATTLY